MFSLKAKSKSERLCAVTPGVNGTAFASIRQSRSGKPVLQHCGFERLAPGEGADAALKRIVNKQGFARSQCTTLLNIGEYQLMMVEAPEVPQSELKAAIRWRIRDLIDFHIDDAVLDVFDAPASGARGVQDHLYVVVSRATAVKERVDMLQSAGAALQVIDIPELALRNVAAQLEADKNGMAVLYFEADQGLITLTRDATLYLARSMDIGYRQLLETPALMERLALELQRSMDYYDRHFQQAPIGSIALCPLPQGSEQLAEQLEQQLGIPVRELSLADVVEVENTVPADQVAECFLAIGAALRNDPAQL